MGRVRAKGPSVPANVALRTIPKWPSPRSQQVFPVSNVRGAPSEHAQLYQSPATPGHRPIRLQKLKDKDGDLRELPSPSVIRRTQSAKSIYCNGHARVMRFPKLSKRPPRYAPEYLSAADVCANDDECSSPSVCYPQAPDISAGHPNSQTLDRMIDYLKRLLGHPPDTPTFAQRLTDAMITIETSDNHPGDDRVAFRERLLAELEKMDI
jgi:hypothetical protein